MNSQQKFIYSNIFNECISLGLTHSASNDAAEAGVSMYNKQQYTGKPVDLIKQCVIKAKKLNKKEIKK